MIHIVCCVCGKKYDEKDDGKIKIVESHGYCPRCLPEAMEDVKRQCDEYSLGNHKQMVGRLNRH